MAVMTQQCQLQLTFGLNNMALIIFISSVQRFHLGGSFLHVSLPTQNSLKIWLIKSIALTQTGMFFESNSINTVSVISQ